MIEIKINERTVIVNLDFKKKVHFIAFEIRENRICGLVVSFFYEVTRLTLL